MGYSSNDYIRGKIFAMWFAMIDRCYNPKLPAYRNYGARGIKVCAEWIESFESFIIFAINNKYKLGLEIDRINNNGDYEPANVHFVTRKENTRNRRNNTLIKINGVTKTLAEWAEISGVGRATIGWRYKNGRKGGDLLKDPKAEKTIKVGNITKTVREWANSIHVPVETFRKRLSNGLTDNRLLQPYREQKISLSRLHNINKKCQYTDRKFFTESKAVEGVQLLEQAEGEIE